MSNASAFPSFRKSLLALAAPVALATGGLAQAATATAPLDVTVNVVNVCQVQAATMNFGNYQAGSATAATQVTPVNVTCNLGTPYTLSLDSGQNGTGTARRLKRDGGSDTLSYQIYRDVAATQVLGLTGAQGISGIGTGLPVANNLYGVISQGQSVPGGTYRDTLTITIDY